MADAYRGTVRLVLCDIDSVLADAHALVRLGATHVARACGAQGVAREVAEHLCQLSWSRPRRRLTPKTFYA